MANLKNTTINDTGFLQLPSGTTAQRPTGAQNGQMRYNTSTNSVEWYDATYAAWFPAGVIPPVATGGTVTNITQGGVNYRVHTFTTVGTSTFTVTRSGPVEFLIVAGGGSGGGPRRGGGGGGGGGLLTGTTTVSTQAYTITVGAGGIASNTGNTAPSGSNSTALGFTAVGGGGGGQGDTRFFDLVASPGGSGGGGNDGSNSVTTGCGPAGTNQGAPGTLGQGNFGGFGAHRGGDWAHGGGGGGAGGPGKNSDCPSVTSAAGARPGNGGPGLPSLISGSVQFYAGGGAGGGFSNTAGATGGIGGGANSNFNQTVKAPSGVANTGGGGGGAGSNSSASGGNGGSGIIIVRYRTS